MNDLGANRVFRFDKFLCHAPIRKSALNAGIMRRVGEGEVLIPEFRDVYIAGAHGGPTGKGTGVTDDVVCGSSNKASEAK